MCLSQGSGEVEERGLKLNSQSPICFLLQGSVSTQIILTSTEIPVYKAHSSLTGTRELTGTNRNLVSWRNKGKYRRSLEHTILSENGEYMLKRLKIQLQGSPAPQILDNLSIRKIVTNFIYFFLFYFFQIVTNFNSLNKIRIHESIQIKLNKGEEIELFLTIQSQLIKEEIIALENDFSIVRGVNDSGKNSWMLKQIKF